jgi:hypothetical protein
MDPMGQRFVTSHDLSPADFGTLRLDAKLDTSQNFKLTWLKRHGRRSPVCKIFRPDADLIWDPWLEFLELEESVLVTSDRSLVMHVGALKHDRSVRYHTTIHP